jgi:phosphoribosylformylglycinamidine synthase
LHGELGLNLPKPNLSTIAAEIHAVADAIQQGLVLAAHDISEGGVAVTLAEMSFKNLIGVKVNLLGELSESKLLFSESGGFILEVAKDNLTCFTALFERYQVPFWIIGDTIKEPQLQMQQGINLPVSRAKEAWENGLREKLQ